MWHRHSCLCSGPSPSSPSYPSEEVVVVVAAPHPASSSHPTKSSLLSAIAAGQSWSSLEQARRSCRSPTSSSCRWPVEDATPADAAGSIHADVGGGGAGVHLRVL